jgi:hypothetical protein
MNGWKIMSRELYIGSGDASRIDSRDPNLAVVSDMEILKNGPWILEYKIATQKLELTKRLGTPLTVLTIPVPRGTELKKLMLSDVKTFPSTSGPNQNFRDIYTSSTTGVNADHVLLTNYGDLLILDNYDWWNTKIFWSAFKQFLIDKGYVYSQYPNHHFSDRTSDNTNITPLINGKKFNAGDPSTWSWNIIDAGLLKHGSGYFNLEKYNLQPNQFVYIKIGTGDWYNALYLTNNDLQMFTFNWSNMRNRTDTSQISTNRATLSWRLSDILKKLGENVDLSGVQYLTVRNGKLILSGGGTSIIYTLGEGLDSAKYFAITTIGDLILLSSDGRTTIYSFFAWLVDKVSKKEAADALKIRQDLSDRITKAGDTKNLVEPKLSDTNKSYRLYLTSATYTCDTQTFNILGWLSKYLKDNVNKTDDFKSNSGINKDKKIWNATYTEFGCPSSKKPSMKIKWTFNGKEKEKTFKDGEDITLTFDTPCVGGYGVCTNNKQKWEKTYDPFPSGSCDVKGDISCVPSAPSTTPPSTTPPSTTPPSTTPPSTTPPSTTPPSTTPPSTTPPSTTPPSTTPPSTTPPSTTPSPTGLDVNCVGSWGDFGDCKDGLKTKTYKVTTPASGNGTCEAIDGETKTEECSNPWYTNPLILGGIGGGIFLLIIMIMMFTMGGSSSPAPAPV